MIPATATPDAVRLRARAELAREELSTLEARVLDVRVRPILVAATLDVRRVRQRIVLDGDGVETDRLDRTLDSVESRLRLVRRAITTT